MHGRFPGANALLYLILTVIVGFLVAYWALGNIDFSKLSDLSGGNGETECQRPAGSPDFSGIRTIPYIDSSSAGLAKRREVHRTAAIGKGMANGFLKVGNSVYFEYGEENSWKGCYEVEEEREGVFSRQLGIYVGSEQDDLGSAEKDIGNARADVWIIR
jgi:hypothetical protein